MSRTTHAVKGTAMQMYGLNHITWQTAIYDADGRRGEAAALMPHQHRRCCRKCIDVWDLCLHCWFAASVFLLMSICNVFEGFLWRYVEVFWTCNREKMNSSLACRKHELHRPAMSRPALKTITASLELPFASLRSKFRLAVQDCCVVSEMGTLRLRCAPATLKPSGHR